MDLTRYRSIYVGSTGYEDRRNMFWFMFEGKNKQKSMTTFLFFNKRTGNKKTTEKKTYCKV
jgi:hypothetical protein